VERPGCRVTDDGRWIRREALERPRVRDARRARVSHHDAGVADEAVAARPREGTATRERDEAVGIEPKDARERLVERRLRRPEGGVEGHVRTSVPRAGLLAVVTAEEAVAHER